MTKYTILLICLLHILISFVFQIEALKATGVTEVALAINYQPEVWRITPLLKHYFRCARVSNL